MMGFDKKVHLVLLNSKKCPTLAPDLTNTNLSNLL